MATKVINGVYGPSLSELGGETKTEAVLYVEQDLTATQQAQARENIGVAGLAQVAYLGTPIGTV